MKKIISLLMISFFIAQTAMGEVTTGQMMSGSADTQKEFNEKIRTWRGVVYVGMPEDELRKIFQDKDRVDIPHKILDKEWLVYHDWTSRNRNDVITFYIEEGRVVKWSRKYEHAPENKGSFYEFNGNEVIKNWFFPTGASRWDGSKVNLLDWNKLTHVQKLMFIKEYVQLLNDLFDANVSVDIDKYILGMDFYTYNCPGKCSEVGATEALDQLLISDGKARAIPLETEQIG
ncbi:MAG: hypothetical protein JXB40_00840 [Candidatus Omnitrophica bacterium]|nr:hypothetical protein [Candidatus Omnitrophota bacterium]